MFTKYAVFLLCGLICTSYGTRMKYERGFPEAIYRGEANIMPDAIYKREPVYQRDAVLQSEPILPHQIGHPGPVYHGESISSKPIYSRDQYMINQQYQPIASEQVMASEQYVRSEPIVRGETIIRTEPVTVRREPIIRAPSLIRAEPSYQSSPILRESPVYANEGGPYTLMVTPCPCSGCSACAECSQSHDYAPPPSQLQDNYYQIQSQSMISQSQYVPQSPIVSHQAPVITQSFLTPRIAYAKPTLIKPTIVHSFITIPKFQRIVRKNYRPITDKVHITTVPLQSSGDINGFQVQSAEPPLQYTNSGNSYQNQASNQDHTPEPQTTPVTTRTAPNRFSMPPISSIC